MPKEVVALRLGPLLVQLFCCCWVSSNPISVVFSFFPSSCLLLWPRLDDLLWQFDLVWWIITRDQRITWLFRSPNCAKLETCCNREGAKVYCLTLLCIFSLKCNVNLAIKISGTFMIRVFFFLCSAVSWLQVGDLGCFETILVTESYHASRQVLRWFFSMREGGGAKLVSNWFGKETGLVKVSFFLTLNLFLWNYWSQF